MNHFSLIIEYDDWHSTSECPPYTPLTEVKDKYASMRIKDGCSLVFAVHIKMAD